MSKPETTSRPVLHLPPLPAAGEYARWGQLYGSAYSLAPAAACREHRGPLLVVAESVHNAARLKRELAFFTDRRECPLYAFPDWETLPYDAFSPHQDAVSERLLTLHELPALERGILVVAANTLMQRLPPADYIAQHVLDLKVGDTLEPAAFRDRLVNGGYQAVNQVMEHGEFAVRGSIIDLFPMGSEHPLRIDLFDDEIDSIRRFDPVNQRSTTRHESIRLLPAREFPLNDEGIRHFRGRYRDRFSGNPQNNPVYRDISEGRASPGCEYYLPLFFETTQTLFDYLPGNTLTVLEHGAPAAFDAFGEEVRHRYEQLKHNVERPILEPDELYLTPDAVEEQLEARPAVEIRQPEVAASGNETVVNFDTRRPPSLHLESRAEQPSARLQAFLREFEGRVLFVCESPGRREVVLDLLRELRYHPAVLESWQAFIASEHRLAIMVGPLEDGILLETASGQTLAVIAEPQLFGARAQQQRRRRSRERDAEAIITSLSDLNLGAPVVHEDHGVGRYQGLQSMEVGGVTTEFLVLEYAGGDKLFVPVSSLDLISRYTGASAENAPLHKLGGEQWQRIRKKAAAKVRDVAAELLDVYARRAARTGHAFHPDMREMNAFAGAFPFEETPDQQTAIDAVIEDMTRTQPMDRVVCGDVGFGKTEVAMRATFTALQDNKQVAILVPTTLLVQQHYQNFLDRFAEWPVRIAAMSRFNTARQQQGTLADLAAGKVDVVIGTHRLLQKNVRFKDLGLVIVDEEHRFGVRHKEKLKALRAEVDTLTLTATPIPRTLNMALAGMRDLSIIATPPEHRTAIKTFVNEWRDDLIQEACHRELMRGGQVYFIHNEVRTIERTAERLADLLPQARIAVAHGQLPERELENIMLDFYHQRYNVLVCTTIIESGIDVPTANTIIINRADHFGLAQLHQLRGRVGRSHHRAYAYLVAPRPGAMTADARKRLEAIESLEDLGAGFTLASHDLEIRGAGELLGDEQSGQIQEIGYSLYTELLERAVQSLKRGEEPLLDAPMHSGVEIDLGIPALLPSDYIFDVDTRLVMYKRISQARDPDALRDLQVELVDRFGLLPEPAKNLFALAELKLRIADLGLSKIKADLKGGFIEFGDQPRIAPQQLVRLIQSNPQRYRFDGGKILRFEHECETVAQQIDFIQTLLLQELADKAA